jgi:beta-glucanase (GH16 family)
MFGTPRSRRALLLLPVLATALTTTASTLAAGPADATGESARLPVTGAPPVTGTWIEQFDGPAGAAPDGSRWRYDLGGNGWGNNESQTYTDRTDNARLSGRGTLLINARGETYTGVDGITRDYTSARLVSRPSFKYGTLTARIRISGAQGAWPAFWTLGADIDRVGWPKCGELDILEALNHLPTLYGSVHGPRTDGPDWQAYGHGGEISPAGGLGDGWHTYGVRWTRGAISWLLDGAVYRTVTRSDLPATDLWAMDNPQNLLLNVAVGGWAGAPAAPEVFRATMEVAWVKAVPVTIRTTVG